MVKIEVDAKLSIFFSLLVFASSLAITLESDLISALEQFIQVAILTYGRILKSNDTYGTIEKEVTLDIITYFNVNTCGVDW